MQMEKNGQTYRLVGFEPYENRFSQKVMLEIWKANCRDCGEAFRVSTFLSGHDLQNASSLQAT